MPLDIPEAVTVDQDQPGPILREHWPLDDLEPNWRQVGNVINDAGTIRDLRRKRHVAHLHTLGPRSLDEFLIEFGAAYSLTTAIENALEQWAKLSPEAVAAAGGNQFPPSPLHSVR